MTSKQDELYTVLRFRNGETIRLRDPITIGIDEQTVAMPGPDAGEIGFGELKAVFFFAPKPEQPRPDRGSLLTIEFDDGEVIKGVAPEYNPTLSGFYLYPQDEDRVEKVFIISSAIASIDVERL